MSHNRPLKQISLFAISFVLLFFIQSCNDDKIPHGEIIVPGDDINFEEVKLNTPSVPKSLKIMGRDVVKEVVAKATGDFELSVNNIDYSKTVTIPAESVNKSVSLQIRCNPAKMGELKGTLTISGENIDPVNISLLATAVDLVLVSAFKDEHLAFGNGYSQTSKRMVNFPVQPENVERIIMYIKLRCPNEGCNEWDMYANLKVKNPGNDEWLEMGRYITPYGVDNSQRGKGFDIDVTDFKSLLTGDVDLKAFIEVWAADGWLLSVDFEIIKGIPDYKYYAITPIISYDNHSLAGIPYGKENSFDVDKCITTPENAEQTVLRTIITGWGHATPIDSDGRPCAEWCFRTHHILIDGVPLFTHDMKGISCDENPVHPQGGNWSPDRAGWCPGMEVPVREDIFDSSMAGITFCYKYELEQWTNDLESGQAYYAISSFVIVKSNTPIEKSIVE